MLQELNIANTSGPKRITSISTDQEAFSNNSLNSSSPISPSNSSPSDGRKHVLTIPLQIPKNTNTAIKVSAQMESEPGVEDINSESTGSDSDDSDESESGNESTDDDDSEDNDFEAGGINNEGNLEQMNETESSNYLFQSQLKQQRRIGQHIVNPGLRMAYPLPNQQRMPPVVIDTSSKGSLGTIASLPGSQRKHLFQHQHEHQNQNQHQFQ